MDNSGQKPAALFDRTAVALSGLCLLHCLALPALILLLPVAGQVPADHWHGPMLLVIVPVSLLAFASGWPRHRDARVLAAGGLGMLLLIVGGTVVHARYGAAADRALTVAGALVLAVAHFRNNRLARHGRGHFTTD